jgi:hypothetical protein
MNSSTAYCWLSLRHQETQGILNWTDRFGPNRFNAPWISNNKSKQQQVSGLEALLNAATSFGMCASSSHKNLQ